MPFYKFTIHTQSSPPITGIRELLDHHDLNAVWRKYEAISKAKYGYQFASFKVVMLSKLDPEVREWLAKRGKTRPDESIWEAG